MVADNQLVHPGSLTVLGALLADLACLPLFSHTFADSHSAALSASATEHPRNPKYLRISAR